MKTNLPKVGTVFLHKYWLEPDYKTPLMCQVTAVRRGTIYYGRQGAHKSFEYCDAGRWDMVCKEVIQ